MIRKKNEYFQAIYNDVDFHVFMIPTFSVGGHIVSVLSVPYVRTVFPLYNKNDFRSIFFEKDY